MSDETALPTLMTAMVLTGHGGYEQLSYRTDFPRPSPLAGEVLIRVGAAGINNTDINTRIGWYSDSAAEDGSVTDGSWTGEALGFPRIQGADVCGRVVAVGLGVDPARLGQRVLVQACLVSLRQGLLDVWLGSERDGGFAQYVSVPSADAHRINSALSDAELASFPCSYATAENLLTRSGVKAGERVLITGATGGVGSAAVQLAKRRGAWRDVTGRDHARIGKTGFLPHAAMALENRDAVALASQLIGGGHANNPRANDGDLHGATPSLGARVVCGCVNIIGFCWRGGSGLCGR